MKIVILMGSPNPHGSTSILVENFRKGAEEKGHNAEIIDVCSMNISPCTGCVSCGYEGECVQNDDNEHIRKALLSCDMIVFATPLYYFGFTGQIKRVIDRFYSIDVPLKNKKMKAVLLSSRHGTDKDRIDSLIKHYLKQAYELGKNLIK